MCDLALDGGAGSGSAGARRTRAAGERDADVEAAAPAEAVGDDATDQRAGDRAEAEDGAEVAGVAAALTRGDEVETRTTWTSAVRPPTPRPWKARQAISHVMVCARPASIEPIT